MFVLARKDKKGTFWHKKKKNVRDQNFLLRHCRLEKSGILHILLFLYNDRVPLSLQTWILWFCKQVGPLWGGQENRSCIRQHSKTVCQQNWLKAWLGATFSTLKLTCFCWTHVFCVLMCGCFSFPLHCEMRWRFAKLCAFIHPVGLRQF